MLSLKRFRLSEGCVLFCLVALARLSNTSPSAADVQGLTPPGYSPSREAPAQGSLPGFTGRDSLEYYYREGFAEREGTLETQTTLSAADSFFALSEHSSSALESGFESDLPDEIDGRRLSRKFEGLQDDHSTVHGGAESRGPSILASWGGALLDWNPTTTRRRFSKRHHQPPRPVGPRGPLRLPSGGIQPQPVESAQHPSRPQETPESFNFLSPPESPRKEFSSQAAFWNSIANNADEQVVSLEKPLLGSFSSPEDPLISASKHRPHHAALLHHERLAGSQGQQAGMLAGTAVGVSGPSMTSWQLGTSGVCPSLSERPSCSTSWPTGEDETRYRHSSSSYQHMATTSTWDERCAGDDEEEPDRVHLHEGRRRSESIGGPGAFGPDGRGGLQGVRVRQWFVRLKRKAWRTILYAYPFALFAQSQSLSHLMSVLCILRFAWIASKSSESRAYTMVVLYTLSVTISWIAFGVLLGVGAGMDILNASTEPSVSPYLRSSSSQTLASLLDERLPSTRATSPHVLWKRLSKSICVLTWMYFLFFGLFTLITWFWKWPLIYTYLDPPMENVAIFITLTQIQSVSVYSHALFLALHRFLCYQNCFAPQLVISLITWTVYPALLVIYCFWPKAAPPPLVQSRITYLEGERIWLLSPEFIVASLLTIVTSCRTLLLCLYVWQKRFDLGWQSGMRVRLFKRERPRYRFRRRLPQSTTSPKKTASHKTALLSSRESVTAPVVTSSAGNMQKSVRRQKRIPTARPGCSGLAETLGLGSQPNEVVRTSGQQPTHLQPHGSDALLSADVVNGHPSVKGPTRTHLGGNDIVSAPTLSVDAIPSTVVVSSRGNPVSQIPQDTSQVEEVSIELEPTEDPASSMVPVRSQSSLITRSMGPGNGTPASVAPAAVQRTPSFSGSSQPYPPSLFAARRYSRRIASGSGSGEKQNVQRPLQPRVAFTMPSESREVQLLSPQDSSVEGTKPTVLSNGVPEEHQDTQTPAPPVNVGRRRNTRYREKTVVSVQSVPINDWILVDAFCFPTTRSWKTFWASQQPRQLRETKEYLAACLPCAIILSLETLSMQTLCLAALPCGYAAFTLTALFLAIEDVVNAVVLGLAAASAEEIQFFCKARRFQLARDAVTASSIVLVTFIVSLWLIVAVCGALLSSVTLSSMSSNGFLIPILLDVPASRTFHILLAFFCFSLLDHLRTFCVTLLRPPLWNATGISFLDVLGIGIALPFTLWVAGTLGSSSSSPPTKDVLLRVFVPGIVVQAVICIVVYIHLLKKVWTLELLSASEHPSPRAISSSCYVGAHYSVAENSVCAEVSLPQLTIPPSHRGPIDCRALVSYLETFTRQHRSRLGS